MTENQNQIKTGTEVHFPTSHSDLVMRYALNNDLATADPYDIWKTPLGFRVKHLFNRHRLLAIAPAAALTLFDTYLNNRARLFYTKQEYPIVRALAAQALLNVHSTKNDPVLLDGARQHLDWLVDNRCTGIQGYGWGLMFDYAVNARFSYDRNTPFSTMTPYALEAFIRYSKLTGDDRYLHAIHGIRTFFERDVKVMAQGDNWEATSYTNRKDRIVINASSYSMASLAMLLPYTEETEIAGVTRRVERLFRFVVNQQASDGSWLYAPDNGSFIDCFHTCIVIKNLDKASKLVDLPGADDAIRKGWAFTKSAMFDEESGLFRRFALANKPGLTKYDLYDSAEALALAVQLGDLEFARRLASAIDATFATPTGIYSQVDPLGLRHNRDFLRWAVMPYIYSLSLLDRIEAGL